MDTSGRGLNLADERLGAKALSATDEFFGAKERLLNPDEPQWREGVYDENGKWMDGWESRRRRGQGFDQCVIRLAAPCTLSALDIDTRHFTGNYAPFASVEACRLDADPDASTRWQELLGQSPLRGNQPNIFALSRAEVWTHLRLNMFPDGGIARLRAYGTVHKDWSRIAAGESLDLVAALNGGRALACSDEHYGSMHNLLLPGRNPTMAGGWETRRRREPGFDWVLLALGRAGEVQRVEVDTAHYKGNSPHQVSLQGALLAGKSGLDLAGQCLYWPALLEPQLVQPNHVNSFSGELTKIGPISHLRVNMHPDGGIGRVRVFGRIG
jgi:allantoicase